MEEKSVSLLFGGSIDHKTVAKNEWNYNCTLVQSSGNLNYANPFVGPHDEMEFAMRTENALEKIEQGHGTKRKGKDFLKELETW